MFKKAKGFTLIELLVVIAIIAVLATLLLLALATAQRKSRDSRRMADVNQIKSAAIQYLSDVKSLPANVAALVPTYMDRVPQDPGNNQPYIYAVSGADSFKVCPPVNAEALTAEAANDGGNNPSRFEAGYGNWSAIPGCS